MKKLLFFTLQPNGKWMFPLIAAVIARIVSVTLQVQNT
jgi:hypothetical protein